MNESTIGIKIANGSYFPILEEDSTKRKRLVLTTVNDNQESVQIDLYRGRGESIDDATYIGSLQIENIEQAEKGTPEIELLIGLDDEGNLDAKASDIKTGESQSLSLSLESLDEEQTYDEPDFEIDQSSDTSDLLTPEEESQLTAGEYEQTIAQETAAPEPRKRNPLLLVLFIVACLGLLGTAAFLLFRHFSKDDAVTRVAETEDTQDDTAINAEDAETGDVAMDNASGQEDAEAEDMEMESEEAAEEAAMEDEQVAAETAVAERTDTAGKDYTGGVWYKIRWGDTLWELADSFYDDPWKYPEIAKKNSIPDPDKIYTGHDLFIPEKTK